MPVRLAALPPLPLNSAFAVTLSRDTTAGAITGGDELRFYLDRVGAGADGRVVMDESSATISDGGYTLTFSEDVAWSRANLVNGRYHCLLYVNGTYDCGCAFTAYTPDGGEANPDTDTATEE